MVKLREENNYNLDNANYSIFLKYLLLGDPIKKGISNL